MTTLCGWKLSPQNYIKQILHLKVCYIAFLKPFSPNLSIYCLIVQHTCKNWSFHLLGIDVGGRGKSPLVKKRASKEEFPSFQPKKIKQEEGCISSEIMELKEKVEKLEANLFEQQQKFWVLEQRLNTGLPPLVFWHKSNKKLTYKNVEICHTSLVPSV